MDHCNEHRPMDQPISAISPVTTSDDEAVTAGPDPLTATVAATAAPAGEAAPEPSADSFAIVVMNADGDIMRFSPEAELTFGYSRHEALGAPLADLIVPPRLRDAHRDGLANYLRTGDGAILDATFDLPAVRKDGTELAVQLFVTALSTVPESFLGVLRVPGPGLAEIHAEHSRNLAELAALKSRFLAVVSHELRTPLTSIASFTEMLNTEGQLPPEEHPTAVAAIQRNTERMLTLLEDLSLLARLESRSVPVEITEVSVPPLVEAAAQLLQALAPQLTPRIDIGAGPPVRSDRRLLRQLLTTMAGAAAACTSGGKAAVHARVARDEWTIGIRVTEARGVTNELLLATMLPAMDSTAPRRSVALSLLLARAIAMNQGGTLSTSHETPGEMSLVLRLPTV
jgi:PAS domain S-box-containing protein